MSLQSPQERSLEREFEIIRTVGQGSFGIVRQVRERADPSRMLAVKSIPIEKLQFKYKDAKDYMKEVRKSKVKRL